MKVTENLEQPTVYVVDDDDAVRRSIAAMVRLADLRVECFASPAEFLVTFEPARRACLILDVRLAGDSGIDLHNRLLRDGAKLPTIFVTGHAAPPITDEARRDGVVAVFRKPFRPQEFLEAIREAVGMPRTDLDPAG